MKRRLGIMLLSPMLLIGSAGTVATMARAATPTETTGPTETSVPAATNDDRLRGAPEAVDGQKSAPGAALDVPAAPEAPAAPEVLPAPEVISPGGSLAEGVGPDAFVHGPITVPPAPAGEVAVAAVGTFGASHGDRAQWHRRPGLGRPGGWCGVPRERRTPGCRLLVVHLPVPPRTR